MSINGPMGIGANGDIPKNNTVKTVKQQSKKNSLFEKDYAQIVVHKDGTYHTEHRDAFGLLKWQTSFEDKKDGPIKTRRNDKDALGRTFRSIDIPKDINSESIFYNSYGFPISKEEFDKLQP